MFHRRFQVGQSPSRSSAFAALALMSLLLGLAQVSYATSVDKLYRSYCSSCHGAEMQGAMGPSLVDGQWLHGSSHEDIAAVINNGVPKKGMPAWRKSLTPAQVGAMVILILERAHAHSADAQQSASKDDGEYSAGGHKFTLEKVATLPGQVWSMDFLPDGKLIVSQRDGKLWLLDKGKVGDPIKGTPQVWHNGQGGLMDVVLHPEYEENGWIYLTLSDPAAGGAMTKVVRGKVRDNQWQDQQDIFVVAKRFYTNGGVHFGSRMTFIDDYLYFSVGDRGQQMSAQDLASPFGKIHRVLHDGAIPADNPFIKQKNALPSIWSYGHRNTQGLTAHPITYALWSAEHGPRGGDEINYIEKGLNYGWPVITYGMNYDGTPMTDKTHHDTMVQPAHYWTPSIAVSQLVVYRGDAFPKWQNQLLVGSLAMQELRLVAVEGKQVVADQLLLKNRGRIRDVANGPDGHPYIVLNNQQGEIYRLMPVQPVIEKPTKR